MKCTIPEIAWHNRDPVYSVDVQPGRVSSSEDCEVYRLASGGTDCHVLVWLLRMKKCGTVSVDFASDLHRHQRAVNAVRFAPSGGILASGDDESMVILWQQRAADDHETVWEEDGEAAGSERWRVLRVLRGHVEDVYDLSWSADAKHLVSGSVDNTAIIWDISKGQKETILKEHKGFVQGVAWDPQNKFIATLGSDRICRIFSVGSKKVLNRISKYSSTRGASASPLQPQTQRNGEEQSGGGSEQRTFRLFHDDTFKSFFRRLSFSPCGELLVTPSGLQEPGAGEPEAEDVKGLKANATYIFTRHNFSKPAACLPTGDNYSIAVRCCPVLFKLRTSCPAQPSTQRATPEAAPPPQEHTNSLIPLPYRCVFAVATKNSVLLYDSQQAPPIATVSTIHYTRLSDLAWSSDGLVLVVSSTDGYCSIVTFSPGELGEPYEAPTEPSAIPIKSEPASSPSAGVTSQGTSESAGGSSQVASQGGSQVTSQAGSAGVKVEEEEEEEELRLQLEDTMMEDLQQQTSLQQPHTSKPDTHKLAADLSSPPKPQLHTPVKLTPDHTLSPGSGDLRKTPKRVPLITLSSPKSKKKIL